MARSVADAAAILNIIVGKDPLDNYTSSQPAALPDYTKALNATALNGVRLGVARQFVGDNEHVLAAYNASLDIFRDLGATVLDPVVYPSYEELNASESEWLVLSTDFKVRLRHPRV